MEQILAVHIDKTTHEPVSNGEVGRLRTGSMLSDGNAGKIVCVQW